MSILTGTCVGTGRLFIQWGRVVEDYYLYLSFPVDTSSWVVPVVKKKIDKILP